MRHPKPPSSRSKSIPQQTLRSWYVPLCKFPLDFDPRRQLNGGHLGGNTLTVTSDGEHADNHDAEEHHPQAHIEQSDKPRAGSKCRSNVLPLASVSTRSL